MYVLSLDLSTTVCGYGIFLIETKQLLKLDFYKFKKDTLVDRGFELAGFLKILCDTQDIKRVVIEERLKSFRAGGTNAEAMLKTAQLNFLGQYLCKELGLEVSVINVQTARKLAYDNFHKVARATKAKNKELAFEFVKKELGESWFPKKIMKSGARKGEEVFIDEAMDMSDAYILGKAALVQLAVPV